MPSLNGYGELVGNLSDCADTNSCHSDSELKDTAAESFVRDGLSKVMKITNICNSEHLSDCGLPDKIITLDGSATRELSGILSLADFNDKFNGKITNTVDSTTHEQLNTKAAAFETVNGESILVYYNPNCEPDLGEIQGIQSYYAQPKLCANFVYDLNGKKGPNTVGKDIGFISAMYSTDPVVVAPDLYQNIVASNVTYEVAISKCKEIGENIKMPNIDEMTSLFYNKILIGNGVDTTHWSSTTASNGRIWSQALTSGRRLYDVSNSKWRVRCVKR